MFGDKARKFPIATLHTLRQQMARENDRPNLALADFIAPAGVADYIGGFVVTAGHRRGSAYQALRGDKDDYSAILLRALADRLAEAFAERLHERVRREFWAYAPDENLANDQLIAEAYRGIRPAPGYPAQPDHTEKGTLFKLLDARSARGREADRELCHVAGLVGVGILFLPSRKPLFRRRQDRDATRWKITRAAKAGRSQEAERWLAPLLNYNPRAVDAA